MKLHHIGIITESYEKLKAQYIESLGYKEIKEITIKDTDNKFCFLSLHDELPYIELIQIEENPLLLPVNHIAYAVDDIEKTYSTLKNQGFHEISKPSAASMVKQKAYMWNIDKTLVIELVTL